jgi:hypothetical protein
MNKEFLQKRSSQKILQKIPPKKNPRKIQKIPNFENIQFPSSHLDAKNPLSLFCLYTTWSRIIRVVK